MEIIQKSVKDVRTITGIHQYEHNYHAVYFRGLDDFDGDIYISVESDGYFNEAILLENNTFVIGHPLTDYPITYFCQIYGVTRSGDTVETLRLSDRFRLTVEKSNDITGESYEYPIDPNLQNGIDEYIDTKKDEIDAYVDDVIDSIPSDYTALSNRVTVLSDDIGDKSSLNTDTKTNLVSAINEVNGHFLDGIDVAVENWLDNHPEAVTTVDFSVVSKVLDDCVVMVADSNLKNGDTVKTLGYYAKNDGGGAYYFIRDPEENESANGYDTIALENGLIAEFVPENNRVNVRQFGAKSGESTFDNADIINNACLYGRINNVAVYIPSGVFYITARVIVINFTGSDSLEIYGDGKSSYIKRMDDSLTSTWAQLFQFNNPQAVSDSDLLHIHDLYIDSNRRGQPNVTDANYEASADLISWFNNATYWLDTVIFENLWFYDGIGDHIDFTGGGVVHVRNIFINRIFGTGRQSERNDIDFPGIPGGNVFISNVDCQRIHTEYNGTPTENKYFYLSNIKCTDLTMAGSYQQIEAINVRVTGRFVLTGQGIAQFTNCIFDLSAEWSNYLLSSGTQAKYMFNNCIFNSYDKEDSTGVSPDFPCYCSFLTINPLFDLVLDGCEFNYVGENSSVDGYPFTFGYGKQDLDSRRAVIRNCKIDKKFKRGIVLYAPGKVLVDNMTLENNTPISMKAINNNTGEITFSNVRIKSGNAVRAFEFSSVTNNGLTLYGDIICEESNFANGSPMPANSRNNTGYHMRRIVHITEPLTIEKVKTLFGVYSGWLQTYKNDTLVYAGSNPELYPEKWITTGAYDKGQNSLSADMFRTVGSGTGDTASRPTCILSAGFQYFDTDLSKMIMWNGSAWVNLDGTALT